MSSNHFVLCADGKWRNRQGKVVRGLAPPPDSPAVMLMGANNSNFDDLQDKLHTINPAATLRVIRRYGSTIPTAWSSTDGQADIDTPRMTWISFSSPTIPQINNGSYDAILASFFASIPVTHPVMMTYIHEIDLPDKIGSTPRADYAAAQARIWNIKQANAQNPQNVHVGPCLTGWAFTTNDFEDYFPTGGEFDFVGADPYRFWRDGTASGYLPDPKSGGTGILRTMAYLLGDPLGNGSQGMPAFAASYGVPMAIGEYGAHPTPNDPNNRPAWLAQTDEYLRTYNTMAALYFHAPYGESGPWYLDRYHTFTGNQNYHPDRENGDPDLESLNMYASLIVNNQ